MPYVEPDISKQLEENEKFQLGGNIHYSKKYQALAPELTDQHVLKLREKNIFKKYSEESTRLNRELWDMKLTGKSAKKTSRRTALDMNDLLDELPKPKQDMVVYSGIAKDSHMPEPGIVHIPSFVSTSLHPAVASFHANQHILRIHIPKDSKRGGLITPFSEYKNEEEYLLKSNQVYKIHPNPTIIDHKGHKLHVWDTEIVSSIKHPDLYFPEAHPEVKSWRETQSKMVHGL